MFFCPIAIPGTFICPAIAVSDPQNAFLMFVQILPRGRHLISPMGAGPVLVWHNKREIARKKINFIPGLK
jgi:hypothetical protein